MLLRASVCPALGSIQADGSPAPFNQVDLNQTEETLKLRELTAYGRLTKVSGVEIFGGSREAGRGIAT